MKEFAYKFEFAPLILNKWKTKRERCRNECAEQLMMNNVQQ